MSIERTEAEFFTEFWRPYLEVSPELALDGSLRSLRVIDGLTFPLRKKSPLSSFEKAVLRGSAAYLAVTAEKAAPVPVSFPELERELANLLLTLPRPLPVLPDFKPLLLESDDFVSPFALGVYTDHRPEHVETVLKRLTGGKVSSIAEAFPPKVAPGAPPALSADEMNAVRSNEAGMRAIAKGDIIDAEGHLLRARTLAAGSPLLLAEACNSLGWLYLLWDKPEKSLAALEESLNAAPDFVPALINKSTVLHEAGREDEADKVDRRLLVLAPFDRAVFRGLVYDPGTPDRY